MRDKELNTYLDVGEDPAYAPSRQEKADAQWRRLERLCAEAEACRKSHKEASHD